MKERIDHSLYQPETYSIALSFMILTMLCWGSWANTVKLCPGYRFQLFYWDYVIGLIAGALLWGFTLGTAGSTGPSFLADGQSAVNARGRLQHQMHRPKRFSHPRDAGSDR